MKDIILNLLWAVLKAALMLFFARACDAPEWASSCFACVVGWNALDTGMIFDAIKDHKKGY